MNETFAAYSKYYDLLYKDKDYEGETEYVCQLLESFAAQGTDILELGSGTGKHARLFSNKGYSVYGVERSSEMVEIARQHDVKNIDYEVSDISSFNIDRRFDITLSLFHVVSYLTSNDELFNTFKIVHSHLRDQGIFLFDVWYSPAVYHQKPEVRIKRLADKELNITRIAEPVIDCRTNIVDVNYEILIENKVDHSYWTVRENHSMRHFSEPEISLLASVTGFDLLHAEEFLTGKAPGNDTWGVCFILQKKTKN